MRRILLIAPIFAVLALAACDYAPAGPPDPNTGIVRQSPGQTPES